MSKNKVVFSILAVLCIIMYLFPCAGFAEGALTHTVAFDSQGGSEVESIIAHEGTLVAKPESPSWLYHTFCGWYKEVDGINEWSFDTDTVSYDITLFAKWATDKYTITTAAGDPSLGAVSGGGTYSGGASVTLIATPNPGCRFVQWLQTGSTSPTYAFTAEENRTVTAQFAPIDPPPLSAASAGYRSIKVSWNAAPGASGCEIYRSDTLSGAYSKIYTFDSAEAASYTNTALMANKIYYYKIRSFQTAGGTTVYSVFSDIVSVSATFIAPSLGAVSASKSSIRLSWNVLSGVSGYELYRSSAVRGRYSRTYTAKPAVATYTNTRLTTGKTYYYKIRAYQKTGSKIVYGPYSPVVSAAPPNESGFTIYYQGDSRWKFSSAVKKEACVMAAYAITINNMGINATPRSVFESNGHSTLMSLRNLANNFGVKAVCALNPGSAYLRSYDGLNTCIHSPSKNAVAAVKEALSAHPEGVILYFKRGIKSHAIVACRYDGDTIYFSDPGRKRTTLLSFKDTWVRYHHRMSYANLVEIIALDKI